MPYGREGWESLASVLFSTRCDCHDAGPAFDVNSFNATDRRIIARRYGPTKTTGRMPFRIHRRMVSADTARSTALAASLGVRSGSTGGSLDVALRVVRGAVRDVSLITTGLGYMGALARKPPAVVAGAVTLKTEIVLAVRLHTAALHAKLRGSLAALPAQATHRRYILRPLLAGGRTSMIPTSAAPPPLPSVL